MRKTDKKSLSFGVSFVNATLSRVAVDERVVDTLLADCRIPKALLQVPGARVTLEQLARFTSSLILASGDEMLGYGTEPLPVGSRSMLLHWLITATTMEQVLERLENFFHIVNKGFSFHRVLDDEQIHLIIDPPYDDEPFVSDMFFLTHRIISWLRREIVPIRHLRFKWSKSIMAQDFRAVFYGADMSFDCDCASVSFSRSLLAKPVRQDQASLALLLEDLYFNVFQLHFETDSWAAEVERTIRDQLDALPTLPELAEAMKVKPYTLQRRLADEGTSYLTIKNHLKRDSAIELLINTDLTIEEISARLGFSETSPFTRTFKQWVGVPPSAYRDSL
ncbi:AraC family transcriptional regulator ligand-binding domain-containing protein [Candidatus Pelagadaptatus aseana]|uniref:AraC family transcriptional regulator n=1 Tax=Candidatus Pelagadaptatus aseana TaxID=3120508 RepID=UPI003C6EABF1